MNPNGDAVYWLYLVSRGHFASLTTDMRADLLNRGWIDANGAGDPVLTASGKAVMDDKR